MTNEEAGVKDMLIELGLNYKNIAEITGHDYFYVKDALAPSKEVPRWVKLVLFTHSKYREDEKNRMGRIRSYTIKMPGPISGL